MKQVLSLRSAFATLSQHNVQIIGVSMDTVKEQKAFSDKFSLPFPLLADTSGSICDGFNVSRPNKRPKRETFVFRNGKIVHHDSAVSPRSQAKDVLKIVNTFTDKAKSE